MSRFSLVRFALALGALLAPFATNLSEPAKKIFLERYDVRYLLPGPERVQTFAVRNAGTAATKPIQVDFEIQQGQIVDFESSHFEHGPSVSYISTLERSAAVTQLAGERGNSLGRFFDLHAGDLRSLFNIQSAWTGSILTRLAHPIDQQNFTQNLPMPVPLTVLQQHASLLKSCPGATDSICSMEQEIEGMERTAVSIRGEADSNWQKSTGVSVAFDEGSFLPDKSLRFFIDPGPGSGEAQFITVKYGSGAIAAKANFAVLPSDAVRVDSPPDLYLSTARLVWKYSRWKALLLLISVGAALVIAFPLLTPFSKMSSSKLLSLAIENPGNNKIWQTLYDKLRDILINDFRSNCIALNKPNVVVSTPDLFDHLKNRALVEFRKFSSDTELERWVNNEMRELAVRA